MNIVRTVTMTNGSPILTGLIRTEDLATNLFLYGSGITIDSQILSIDSHTQVTLTKNATVSQTVSVQITNAGTGVFGERQDALIDVQNIMIERGDLILFMIRPESSVTRDLYGTIIKRSQAGGLAFRAFPVEFNPSEKKLEKAGIREQCGVLVYTAMQDWINYGIDYKDIEMATRDTVKLQGMDFEIKSKGLTGQFNDSYLYVTFGLNEK